MTALQMPTRPTYANLLWHQLLPEQYCFPKILMNLTQADRDALLHDPLKAVASSNRPVFSAQRELFRSFMNVATDLDLRQYARGMNQLSVPVWDYVAGCENITRASLSEAVMSRIISSVDAEELNTAFHHWNKVLLKTRPFVPSAS